MVNRVSLTSACRLCQSVGQKQSRKVEKSTSMKRKLFLTTISLGVTSALLMAATAQAADDTKSSTSTSTTSSSDQGATGKGSASISGQSQKFMKLSQLTGSSLKNTSGESLGQINDFVVDPSTGRIEFAAV